MSAWCGTWLGVAPSYVGDWLGAFGVAPPPPPPTPTPIVKTMVGLREGSAADGGFLTPPEYYSFDERSYPMYTIEQRRRRRKRELEMIAMLRAMGVI